MADDEAVTMADPEAYRRELVELLGADGVIPPGPRVSKYLRDFSWYSPVLENALSDTTVEAVALPTSLDELLAVVSLAARHRVPLTMRGAGTGNYGQSLPLEPGIIVDVRGVAGVIEVSEGRIAALPGTIMRELVTAAAASGQELAVLPSTFRVATVAGFISGGSGGPGAALNGDLWAGNVLAVELVTVEEEPRAIRLEGAEVASVLHMYGTIGVITRVELRLIPAAEYGEFIALFDELESALRFGWEAVDSAMRTRLVSAHQAPLGSTMTPIADSIPPDKSVVFGWIASADADAFAELAASFGGEVIPWPKDGKDVTQFVFSHAILWARRAHPGSSWLQCEFARGDEDAFVTQALAIDARYHGVFMQHVEFVNGGEDGVRAMGIPAVVGLPDHEGALEQLIGFCEWLGMTVMNPHSFVVEEGGFVGDVSAMLALKAECDPHGILNPGKLGGSFFTERMRTADAPERIVLAPEQVAEAEEPAA